MCSLVCEGPDYIFWWMSGSEELSLLCREYENM